MTVLKDCLNDLYVTFGRFFMHIPFKLIFQLLSINFIILSKNNNNISLLQTHGPYTCKKML